MPRFAFIFLLPLLIVGCKTPGRVPQPTVLVHSSQSASGTKTFWLRTAQLFQPLMPDRGNRTAETGSPRADGGSQSDIVPPNHSSHSLYKAGSIFPSPALVPQNPAANVIVAGMAANDTAIPASPNPLQIQAEDSETLKSLLREIAIMPPEKRKVDDAKLKELLTAFRSEIMDSEFESEYLALLRKRVLPESKATAPSPNTEIAEIRRSANTSVRNQEPDDEYIYDEPIAQPVARRMPSSSGEPVVAQSSMSMATPVYPNLLQLPSAASAVVQASYQSQRVLPPSVNSAGYGAGDWQTPTRAAIEQLRYAIEQTPNGRTVSNEMRLRFLEMLLDNKAEAVRPMQSADKTVSDFLGHQVLGFTALLDDSMQNRRSQYISAAYRFGEGLQELQNLCPIKLKNVTFVEDWLAYGQYVPRETQEFYPGDKFLVYMEIDNPTVRRIPDGFEVGISLSYEIRDVHAAVIVKQDLGPSGERSLSRKRDYALAVPVALPTSLAPGQYQLRISATDLNDDSMQYAEEQIPFRVAPSVATGL